MQIKTQMSATKRTPYKISMSVGAMEIYDPLWQSLPSGQRSINVYMCILIWVILITTAANTDVHC